MFILRSQIRWTTNLMLNSSSWALHTLSSTLATKSPTEHGLLFTDSLHTVLGDLLGNLHVGCNTGLNSRPFVVVKRKTLLSDKLFIAKDILTLHTVRCYFCRELVDSLTVLVTTNECVVKPRRVSEKGEVSSELMIACNSFFGISIC